MLYRRSVHLFMGGRKHCQGLRTRIPTTTFNMERLPIVLRQTE
jgi:hypothetical protein